LLPSFLKYAAQRLGDLTYTKCNKGKASGLFQTDNMATHKA